MIEDKSTLLNEIIRPCIDSDNTCNTSDGIKILSCSVADNGNISGITEDGKKALYIFDDNKWLFGQEISKLNLINLKERTKDERLKIIEKANEKKRENIQAKKDFNELAKAMLEQTLSERQIKSILGDNTNVLLDSSVASVMLASMIQGALNGSFKCAEFVRDSAGFKPKNDIGLDVSANIMTEADKSLIDKALKTS